MFADKKIIPNLNDNWKSCDECIFTAMEHPNHIFKVGHYKIGSYKNVENFQKFMKNFKLLQTLQAKDPDLVKVKRCLTHDLAPPRQTSGSDIFAIEKRNFRKWCSLYY